MSRELDVAVVGAGVHGLCAAFALRRRGHRVVVLDRFDAGHDRGGSHGAARITRSSMFFLARPRSPADAFARVSSSSLTLSI